METEKRFVEFRRDGDTLAGIAIRYNEPSYVPQIGTEELFEPRSLVPDPSGIILNLMHDRLKPIMREGHGLVVSHSDKEISLEARLGDTPAAIETRKLLEAGVLSGFSIEFRSRKENRKNGTRVIQAGELINVAVVDRPAHKGSLIQHRFEKGFNPGGLYPVKIEIRQRFKRPTITGFIEYDKETVTSARHKTSQIIKRGAFAKSLKEMDVFLLGGYDYGEPLASTGSGNLVVRDTPERLEFEARDLPRTAAASAVIENGRKFPQAVQPGYIVNEETIEKTVSQLYDDFALTVVEEAALCELNILTRGNDGSGVKLAGRRRR